MKKTLLFILLVFFMFNCITYISAKDKDKDKKEKKEKKEKKNKDKNKDILDEDFTALVIKSEIIYSEKNQKIDENIIDMNQLPVIEKINSISKILEDLLGETNDIKKDIKIITPGNGVESIKIKYNTTKIKLNLVSKGSKEILNNLNEDDKGLIIKQEDIIQKSNKKLNKLLFSIDNTLDKNNKNEEIFNKMKMVEKEIQTLYRQYRAIEWILSSY